MTTTTLRNKITVQGWYLGPNGATVSYKNSIVGDTLFHLLLSPLETVKVLNSIASIDGYRIENGILEVKIEAEEDCLYSFNDFVRKYNLSQYDALSLAIRHELQQYTDLEIDDLFKIE
jgi:hypothetical protein